MVSYCHQRLSSCCCGQGLVVSYYLIMLLWSGVRGQLLSSTIIIMLLRSGVHWWSAIISSCCCGQGLVVSYCHQRLSSCCCGQGFIGGQLLSHHVAVVRGWWSATISSCCCGQGLVVLDHHLTVVSGWWLVIDTFFRRTLSRSFRENEENGKISEMVIWMSISRGKGPWRNVKPLLVGNTTNRSGNACANRPGRFVSMSHRAMKLQTTNLVMQFRHSTRFATNKNMQVMARCLHAKVVK